jgi:tetratricopeptide (TPR) repeat protein
MNPTSCRFAALVAVAAVSPLPLFAQGHDHGPAEQLGRVSFPVSCNAEAQRRFERAMALLHSFWWEAGDKAFREVAEADGACAMAYWGLAINAWGNPFAGGQSGQALAAAGQAAERAAALGGKTPRERGFIAAVATLYRDHATVPNAVRLRAYSDTMARVYHDTPGDVEVAIYYALSVVATAAATDTTFIRQKAAAAILNPLFQRFPQHPGLAHYIIHANDSPRLASLGLDAARRYARIAPSAPHAQHMPSHIFIRLGLWEDNIASNQRSFDAGAAHAKAQGWNGVAAHEFHALDYMVYGYLQLGKDAAARGLVARAESLSAVEGRANLIAGYNGSALAARVALERGDWRAAAALPIPAGHSPVALGAVSRFARGIGAARSGDTAQARAEVAALADIEASLASQTGYNWSRIVGIKRRAVTAWLALATGDTASALRLAAEAADLEDVTEKHPVTPGELLPARELQGDLLMATGRHAEARAAYEATLRREPGRARSLFGVGRAAELAGDQAGARVRYRAFLDLMTSADGDRPELAQARRFLAS